jgi:hypothetical protein
VRKVKQKDSLEDEYQFESVFSESTAMIRGCSSGMYRIQSHCDYTKSTRKEVEQLNRMHQYSKRDISKHCSGADS